MKEKMAATAVEQKKGMMKITHYSECDTDYVRSVRECKTLDELKQITAEYRELAEDAYQAVQKMDDLLFEQFCKGRGKFKPSQKWMEMYGPVLLPRVMMLVGLEACRFGVPFGAMYLRMKDLGKVPV